MLVRIVLLFLVHFITIPVFDPNIFLHIKCHKKLLIYLVQEPIKEHLFCENFTFNRKEVNEFQTTNFEVSKEESIVFKNCDIGILNHKFLKKFPKALSIQLDNVTFAMSQSRISNLPIREISIYGGNVSCLQNYKSWNNLTDLRTFVLGRTSGLYLKNNTITNNFFQGNKKLESINIFKENISSIEESVFYDLLDLQSVALTDLKLKSLPVRLFYRNGLLEFVNLSGNNFGRIPGNFYSVRLRHLTLIGCNITTVESNDLFYKSQLEFLVLDYNRIQTFKEGIFGRLNHLKYLSVANNELRNLTFKDFGEIEDLEGLDVEWNYLNTSNFLPKDWNRDWITVKYLDQKYLEEKGTDRKFGTNVKVKL